MAAINSFEDLEVWQMSMTLTEECYRLTSRFPREEIYGLISQMRRASVSVPSNIAEGHGRENTGAFIQHLRIAQGSLKELQTQLRISRFDFSRLAQPSASLSFLNAVAFIE